MFRKILCGTTLAIGWTILEEEPGREMVVGAVTQPWEPVVRFRGLPGPEFLEFAEPGFTKIAWSIAARQAEAGVAELATETGSLRPILSRGSGFDATGFS